MESALSTVFPSSWEREESPYATVGLQVSEEFLKEREVDAGTLCAYI